MKRHLKITIDAGERTCYEQPGKPCQWLRTSHFGTVWLCGLFDSKRLTDSKGDGTGWILRLPECLEAEVNE